MKRTLENKILFDLIFINLNDSNNTTSGVGFEAVVNIRNLEKQLKLKERDQMHICGTSTSCNLGFATFCTKYQVQHVMKLPPIQERIEILV